jgi:hypothetical protein
MMPESDNQTAGYSSSKSGESPPCFGDPAHVCPMGEDGFIQPQATCLPCRFFKNCLQQALMAVGLISGPSKQNPVVSKTTGFLKRWSNKKLAGKHSQDHPT